MDSWVFCVTQSPISGNSEEALRNIPTEPLPGEAWAQLKHRGQNVYLEEIREKSMYTATWNYQVMFNPPRDLQEESVLNITSGTSGKGPHQAQSCPALATPEGPCH